MSYRNYYVVPQREYEPNMVTLLDYLSPGKKCAIVCEETTQDPVSQVQRRTKNDAKILYVHLVESFLGDEEELYFDFISLRFNYKT